MRDRRRMSEIKLKKKLISLNWAKHTTLTWVTTGTQSPFHHFSTLIWYPIPGTRYYVLPGSGYYCSVNLRHHTVITYGIAGLCTTLTTFSTHMCKNVPSIHRLTPFDPKTPHLFCGTGAGTLGPHSCNLTDNHW